MIQAYASQQLTNQIIDSVDLNLPPGVLTKMAQKAGLVDKINEKEILEIINRRLAPKFRQMICEQQQQQLRVLQATPDKAEAQISNEE